ncbi:MAG TPA: LLM class flavin-dependent oxidoreductase, partial [Metabacillus sp.]|nr:LLM class flavin-dependent oxidoreductase [Metabacillus sp.]
VTHRGARLAAEKGTAFTYGHFINPINGLRAMQTYRENFQPSNTLPNPKTTVCMFVICAPTQERAEEIAISQDIWLLAVEKGFDTHILPVQEA